MDDKDIPEGWITETLPGGTMVHRLQEPINLPHNRIPKNMYVIKIWAVLGLAMVGLLVFYGFYLVLR